MYFIVLHKEQVLIMAANQMLTVRIPEEDLEKLNQLAAVQGRPRSQLVHEALSDLISTSENLLELNYCSTSASKSRQQRLLS
ncbi:MAG: CopG family ribbon-helix-helix protein [Granulosicoccus sp.]